jgi:hypothetical protein
VPLVLGGKIEISISSPEILAPQEILNGSVEMPKCTGFYIEFRVQIPSRKVADATELKLYVFSL